LGVHEHWNSTAGKQYTRNLGTGAGIELISSDPFALYGDVAPKDCDVDGSDLAAWILAGGVDLAPFAQNFGRNACQ
jgi:hypothetical protein